MIHGNHTIMVGECMEVLKQIEDGQFRCCVTSPPYWALRDYDHKDQLGCEETPEKYIENIVNIFREVRRVLTDDGTCWINLGDTYKGKELVGIPWRVALALQADGWHLRSDIIWHKPNPKPENVNDRPTRSHEYLFMFSKQKKYYYDKDSIAEPIIYTDRMGMKVRYGAIEQRGTGYETRVDVRSQTMKNKRTVWTVPVFSYHGSHFATFPPDLIEPCILAGSAVGDTVLDPFSGSGTTGEVACWNRRHYVGIELNPEYAALSEQRIGMSLKPGTYTDQRAEEYSPLFSELDTNGKQPEQSDQEEKNQQQEEGQGVGAGCVPVLENDGVQREQDSAEQGQDGPVR